MSRFATALAVVFSVLAWNSVAQAADVHVNGYTTKNGTYVAPYTRTAPNNTTLDNYSTKPNVNPYTGAVGTKSPDPYPTYTTPAYTSPLLGTTQQRRY